MSNPSGYLKCPRLEEHGVGTTETGIYYSQGMHKTKAECDYIIDVCSQCPLDECVYDYREKHPNERRERANVQ